MHIEGPWDLVRLYCRPSSKMVHNIRYVKRVLCEINFRLKNFAYNYKVVILCLQIINYAVPNRTLEHITLYDEWDLNTKTH